MRMEDSKLAADEVRIINKILEMFEKKIGILKITSDRTNRNEDVNRLYEYDGILDDIEAIIRHKGRY